MGQNAKAARYYLAAAEIYRDAGLPARTRELLNKVLELDPDNAQAQAELTAMGGGAPAAPSAPAAPPSRFGQTSGGGSSIFSDAGSGGSSRFGAGSAPSAAPGVPRPQAAPATPQPQAAPAPSAAPGPPTGQVMVPVPCVFLRRDQQAAIISQITSAPDPKVFPFDPLPKVDPQAMAEKQRLREEEEEARRLKERTAVESAFGSGPAFQTGGGGFLNQARPTSARSKSEDDSGGNKPRSRRQRGGSLDFAESIRKKLQGS